MHPSTATPTTRETTTEGAGSVGGRDRREHGPCRFCGTPLRNTSVDLGMSPLCESCVIRSALDVDLVAGAAHSLVTHGLLTEIPPAGTERERGMR